MVLGRFIEKWTNPDYPPVPVDAAGLDLVEAHFQFKLPLDYRAAVVQVGLPHLTLSLLHSVVKADLDIHIVSDFFEPAAMIENTEDWRKLGLPSNLVAFANDSGGSLFCFDIANSGLPAAPVWFFDHDFEESELVSLSFTAWIERFCEIDFINFEDE